MDIRSFTTDHEEEQYLDTLKHLLLSRLSPMTVLGVRDEYTVNNGVFPLFTTQHIDFEMVKTWAMIELDDIRFVVEAILNGENCVRHELMESEMVFSVLDAKVSCVVYQTACSILLYPRQVARSALLLEIVSHMCDLNSSKLVYMVGAMQLSEEYQEFAVNPHGNQPLPFPRIRIDSDADTLRKLRSSHIALIDYEFIVPEKTDVPELKIQRPVKNE